MDNIIERYEELLLFVNSEDFIEEADPMGYVEEWQELFDLRRQIESALNVAALLNAEESF